MGYIIECLRSDGTWVELQRCYSAIVASCWLALYAQQGITNVRAVQA
jgi:hypothetical protein